MAVITTFGRPFRQGLHSTLHAEARPVFSLYAAVLCLPILLFPLSPGRIAGAVVMMIAVPTLLLAMGNRLFGGVNGDIAGASNEITRAAILLSMVLAG